MMKSSVKSGKGPRGVSGSLLSLGGRRSLVGVAALLGLPAAGTVLMADPAYAACSNIPFLGIICSSPVTGGYHYGSSGSATVTVLGGSSTYNGGFHVEPSGANSSILFTTIGLPGHNVTITNSGTNNGTSGTADAVDLQTNKGSITVITDPFTTLTTTSGSGHYGRDGIHTVTTGSSGGDINIANAADISVQNDGIFADTKSGDITIGNVGSISAGQSSHFHGATDGVGIYAHSSTGDIDITNYGAVSARKDGIEASTGDGADIKVTDYGDIGSQYHDVGGNGIETSAHNGDTTVKVDKSVDIFADKDGVNASSYGGDIAVIDDGNIGSQRDAVGGNGIDTTDWFGDTFVALGGRRGHLFP